MLDERQPANLSVRVICMRQDRPSTPWVVYWTPVAEQGRPGIARQMAALRQWTAYTRAGPSGAFLSEHSFKDVAPGKHMIELVQLGMRREVLVSESEDCILEIDLRELVTIELLPTGLDQELIDSSQVPITWSYADEPAAAAGANMSLHSFANGAALALRVLPGQIRIQAFSWPWVCDGPVLDVRAQAGQSFEVSLTRAEETVVRLLFTRGGLPHSVGYEIMDFIELRSIGTPARTLKSMRLFEDVGGSKGVEFGLDGPGRFQVMPRARPSARSSLFPLRRRCSSWSCPSSCGVAPPGH